MRLYHYTCDHGLKAVGRRGMLRPQPSMFTVKRLLWLTDQAVPNRCGLGLTSQILDCDRLSYRYLVDTEDAIPWSQFRFTMPLEMLIALEHVEGAQPETWFVHETAVLGVLDREYQVGCATVTTERSESSATLPSAAK